MIFFFTVNRMGAYNRRNYPKGGMNVSHNADLLLLESPEIIKDIKRAINAEYSTILCYQKIADRAPAESIRKRILEIQKDEKKHFQVFNHLYTYLTGKHVKPKIIEPCPEDYKQAVEHAFYDEQETVDFYLNIYDRAKTSAVRKAFKRAALDEQNHAVWFLYFLSK